MDVLKKEQIKDRLVKIAADRWNVQESEVEANFDPLMLLLFDALASELEGVGNLIKDIQGNLLQELSGLMLPQSLLNAKPASSVISAMPNEKTCTVSPSTNFSTSAQVQKPGEQVRETEVNFTPIGTFKLSKLETGHLIIGNRVYKLNADGRKTLRYEGSPQDMVQEIHFTLQNLEALSSLEGLQVFFDLKGHSEANNFYFSIQQATLMVNGSIVTLAKGYHYQEQFNISLKDALSRTGDYTRKIKKEVAGIYSRQFINISVNEIPAKKNEVKNILLNAPDEITKEIDTPQAILITLKLGRAFAMNIIERMQIGINAFPVINRNQEQVSFKTDRWINIVPLQTKGSYLDIDTIETSDGTKYQLHENIEDKELKEGDAIVRLARVGKSSSMEIRNTIQGLLEVMRDESAYFSRISNDFVAARLIEISKILTRLEDQVLPSEDAKPSFRYLLLKPRKQGENLLIRYWVTDPKSATYIKSGQTLRGSKHTLTAGNSTFFLTPAMGGVETRSEYAQKQMLVRQLSSKGKIISAEDIKLLCFELFGNRVKHIEIDKKMQVLPGKDAGISRVITVDITVAKQQFPAEELTYLESELRFQLTRNASFVFPIEIEIKEEL